MKKLLLSTLMLFVSIGGFAYDCEVDGIYYDLNTADRTANVTYKEEYQGNNRGDYSGVVHIPEEVVYDGIAYNVTSIGKEAFLGCRSLTAITISNSVTSIGSKAFMWCTGMVDLTISNSVVEFGANAFYGCSGLTEVTIPDGVISIGAAAFYGCSGLRELTIPNSVKSIDSSVFRECNSLANLTIGNGVTSIGEHAFSGCSGLTSIVSLNTTPPNIVNVFFDYSAFDTTTEQNAILHVPAGCVEAYQQANYWKNFVNIQDDASTDIESVNIDKQGKNRIYTFDGAKLNTSNLSNLPAGIYIVNGKKVVVK